LRANNNISATFYLYLFGLALQTPDSPTHSSESHAQHLKNRRTRLGLAHTSTRRYELQMYSLRFVKLIANRKKLETRHCIMYNVHTRIIYTHSTGRVISSFLSLSVYLLHIDTVHVRVGSCMESTYTRLDRKISFSFDRIFGKHISPTYNPNDESK